MQTWKHPRTGYWYVWLKFPGEGSKRVATGCQKQAEAKVWGERRQAELLAPKDAPENTTTVEFAIEQFLKGRARVGRSDSTLQFYETKLGHFLRFIDEGKFPSLLCRVNNVSVLEAYVDLRNKEVEPATVAKEVGAMLAVLRYAKKRELWNGDLDKVRPEIPTGYVPRRRFLSPLELVGLVGYFNSWRPYVAGHGVRLKAEPQPHKAAMITFAVATSSRWGEVERAQREDIRPLQIDIRGTKTERSLRSVPRGIPMFESMLKWSLERANGTNGKLFQPWTNVRRELRAACEALEIDPVSPNDLRRTFATWLVEDGRSLDAIAQGMGHVDTRMVYRVYGKPTVGALGKLLGA